ncbi:MAG: cell division protein FtsK, partial [Ruminococcus sp.]|nr:cell division protein FtsK [Ruminococcus sp.]
MDNYNIKEKAFSKYIAEAPKEGEDYVNVLGLTFIFIQREKGLLPKYCGSIVELDPKLHRISKRYNLLSHETLSKLARGNDSSSRTDDIIEYTDFSNDYIFGTNIQKHSVTEDDFQLAFKRLSSIYYTRVAENGKVPSMVTLFELYQDIYNLSADAIQADGLTDVIRNNWKTNEIRNEVTRNMKVAMGKNEHGITYLDLHENFDGPHMLVAGTTGSGKSETIITYLIGLCVKYSPLDLNLMLVDMKGGGFSERLGSLPHCVGTVTNTAGESQGISAVYMLKRFLESLNAEVKNRQIILADLDVDNADAYIRILRKLRRIHELKGTIDEKQQKEREELINEIRDSKKEKR